jgi:hypothetical protein
MQELSEGEKVIITFYNHHISSPYYKFNKKFKYFNIKKKQISVSMPASPRDQKIIETGPESPRDRAMRVRHRRDTILMEKQKAAEDFISLKANRAQEKLESDTRKVALQMVMCALAGSGFAKMLPSMRLSIEVERQRVIRLDEEDRAASKIQRTWILTFQRAVSDIIITTRENRISEIILQRQAGIKLSWFKLTDAAKGMLRERKVSADRLICVIRQFRKHPFSLAKAYLLKIKKVQRFVRVYRRISVARVQLLSLAIEPFYLQLVVHINAISSGKYGFDLTNGDPVGNSIVRYCELCIIVFAIVIRIII